MVTATKRQIADSLEKKLYLEKYVRERLFPDRFLNLKKLTKLSKCIGFIGTRGSTKSLSTAAMTIIDYLIPGYDVYSNMSIKWGVKFGDYILPYETKPLDKAQFLNFDVSKSLVVVDEVNLEYSEARRSMTNRNLTFNKLIQQLRKKQLNMIYTVQSEMWVDERLRFQTDLFIKCSDVMFRPGGIYLPYDFGEISEWKGFDMSGFLGHGKFNETHQLAFSKMFYGKQWWKAYDTLEIQAEEELKYGQPEIKSNLGSGDTELLQVVYDAVEQAVNEGIEGEIPHSEFVNYYTPDHIMQEKEIQRILTKMQGVTSRYSSGIRKWDFSLLVKMRERELVA